ncbi:hypothetical protein Tcan_01173, partial [Toxocara canis]
MTVSLCSKTLTVPMTCPCSGPFLLVFLNVRFLIVAIVIVVCICFEIRLLFAFECSRDVHLLIDSKLSFNPCIKKVTTGACNNFDRSLRSMKSSLHFCVCL